MAERIASLWLAFWLAIGCGRIGYDPQREDFAVAGGSPSGEAGSETTVVDDGLAGRGAGGEAMMMADAAAANAEQPELVMQVMHPDFANIDGLQLVGQTQQTADTLLLTNGTNSKGAVFLAQPLEWGEDTSLGLRNGGRPGVYWILSKLRRKICRTLLGKLGDTSVP